MRDVGLKRLLVAVALAIVVGEAPASAMTQASAAPAASDADPASQPEPTDQATAEPSTELRIDQPFAHAWLGAADADVTLVVFADYACPACRVAQPVIDQLLAQDTKLRVVYRLLDNEQGGRAAALASLAVAEQGTDWGRFHRALEAGGEPSPKAIAQALAASGLDPATLPGLKDDDPDSSLAAELNRNDSLLAQRNGTALPSWLIGDGPAHRGFDLQSLKAAIAAARQAQRR
jgi:protein-disulfide isomerase